MSLPPGLVVVLDDYDRVTNPGVHDTVHSCIDYLPRSTPLVISSRAAPPLNLGRLRVRGLVEEFGRTDLAFSIDETSRALTEQRGPLPAQDVATIHRRTEGWAAGVYLAALYPEGHANAFQGTLHWVRIDLEDDDVSHLEPEESKYHRIMARQ